MSEQDAARELERRGQAIADAMGRYRGTEPLIEAVRRMSGQLFTAERERDLYLIILQEAGLERLDLVVEAPEEFARIIGRTLKYTLAAAAGKSEDKKNLIEFLKSLNTTENMLVMAHAAHNAAHFYELRGQAASLPGYDKEAWDALQAKRGF